MSGMERIQNCSAGVFDVEKLDVKTFAESDCFSFRKFIDLTSEWGRPEPRPKTRYEKSPHVGCDRIAEKLAKFSVNKVLGRKKNESLQDVIKDYIMTVDGINHMFCVHSHERPQVFFGRTILDVAVRLSSKSHELKAFPTVLIVTRTVESAKSIVGSFIRRKSERSCPIHIGDLGNLDDVREESSLRDKTEPRRKSDILIGSAHDVQAYLGRLKSNRELDLLKLTVKHCILCDVEGLPVDQEFEEACKRICSTFQFSPTTFIFMYNFLKADSNLLSAKRACQQMVKGKVFIEIERNGDRKIFGNVKFHWVTTADDLANHLAVVELSKGNENFNFDAAKMVLTARVQKMQQCAKIIDDLREKRSDRNANQNQTRKERILVITKDSRTAISVTIYLRLAGAGVYTVKKMLVRDPVEVVETRNFEFRWADLDVLVIDWRSIRSVNRGTVDSVIMFDAPERMFFDTVLNTELQNLVSRNCVDINLHFLIDLKEDVMLIGQFLKFIEKHNKQAPQWCVAMHEIYAARWRNNPGEQFRATRLHNVDENLNFTRR